jgi:O-acetyl-ADP-ribose deacetylase (regulator of RNase III)
VWRGGNDGEDDLLASCYRNTFALAEQHNVHTIAFPAISTGAYGFPLERAARIAVTETKNFLRKNSSIEKVIFVCFNRSAYDAYVRAVEEIIG